MADECEHSAEASTCDGAVGRELKHHDAVVGQDRRRKAAATQHRYTEQNKRNLKFIHFQSEGSLPNTGGQTQSLNEEIRPFLPISSVPSTSPRTVRESYTQVSDSSRSKSAKLS